MFITVQSPPLWKAVSVGTICDATGLRRALRKIRCRIDNDAIKVLYDRSFSMVGAAAETLRTTRISVRELGYARGGWYSQICDRATSSGLRSCPPELGPQLRLQYLDQAADEFLWIAMPPVTGVDKREYIFAISAWSKYSGSHEQWEKELWLLASCVNGGRFLKPTSELVFLLPG